EVNETRIAGYQVNAPLTAVLDGASPRRAARDSTRSLAQYARRMLPGRTVRPFRTARVAAEDGHSGAVGLKGTMPTTTEVMIVGGSLNGLTTAALLAYHGVRCVVAERHPGTTVQYKFAGISPRSMEIFRGLGMEEQIRANR